MTSITRRTVLRGGGAVVLGAGKGGIPHNLADIVTRVSRAVDRGAAMPATMRVEYAGDDALVEAEHAAENGHA